MLTVSPTTGMTAMVLPKTWAAWPAARCVNALQVAGVEAFVEIQRDAGVPVTIGGRGYQAMVSPSGEAVDLE